MSIRSKAILFLMVNNVLKMLKKVLNWRCGMRTKWKKSSLTNHWHMPGINHTEVLNDFETVENIDYNVQRYDFRRIFATLIPAREIWGGNVTDLEDYV